MKLLGLAKDKPPRVDEGSEAVNVQGNVIIDLGNFDPMKPPHGAPTAPREGAICCVCEKYEPGWQKAESKWPICRRTDDLDYVRHLLTFFPALEPHSKRLMENPRLGVGLAEIEPYAWLTINEYFEFIGKLHNLSENFIHERIQYLSKILQLPSERSLVRLTDEEYCNVAIAATLLYSPSLLILWLYVEKTTGSIRKRVWEVLKKLSRDEGLSVLVMTDDFEEAIQADDVALWWFPDRRSVQLARDSPKRLLKELECETLEEANEILEEEYVSARTRRENSIETDSAMTSMNKDQLMGENARAATMASDVFIAIAKTHTSSWHRISMLITNELIEFKRSSIRIPLMIWGINLYLLFVVLMLGYLGEKSRPHLPVAVVQSNTTSFLAEPLLASLRWGTANHSLLNDTLLQRPYFDLDEALASAENGDTCGVLRIGSLPTTAQYQILLRNTGGDRNDSEKSTLDINIEGVDQEIRFLLQKAIEVSFEALRQNISVGRNESSTELSLEVNDPVFGPRLISHFGFMIPGFFMSLVYVTAMATTTIITSIQIDPILTRRSWALGITRFERAFSILCILPCFLFVHMICVLLGMLLLCWLNLLPLRGSLILVAILILVQSFQGMAVGLTISSLDALIRCRTRLFVLYPPCIMLMTYSPSVMFPRVLRDTFNRVLPTRSTEALRDILYRGWGIEKDEIFTAFKQLLIESQVFLLLSAVLVIFMFMLVVRRSS